MFEMVLDGSARDDEFILMLFTGLRGAASISDRSNLNVSSAIVINVDVFIISNYFLGFLKCLHTLFRSTRRLRSFLLGHANS